MSLFNCNPEWPVCIFDYTYKNKIPHFFSFKIELDLTMLILDEYFSSPQTDEAKAHYG